VPVLRVLCVTAIALLAALPVPASAQNNQTDQASLGSLGGSSNLLEEHVVQVSLPEEGQTGFATPGPGQYHYGHVLIGSWPGDVVFKVTGWNFGTPTPWVVLAHPRQSVNLDKGWSDQFATQVIETGRDFVRIRVRRLDCNGCGWGQNLQVDFLVIE